MALYATALRLTCNPRSQNKIETFAQGLVQNFLSVLLVIFVLLKTTDSLFSEPKLEAYYRRKKINREPRGENCHDFPVSVNDIFPVFSSHELSIEPYFAFL